MLGHTIEGKGFGEVEEAVTLIVNQPACARFISRQLAIYFVADNPPPPLVERMAQTFMHTDGDIAAVLRTMFLAREFNAALGGKFKDPMRFVVSAVRFAYDGRPISNTRPLLNWLNGLGEAPFGRQTPGRLSADGTELGELRPNEPPLRDRATHRFGQLPGCSIRKTAAPRPRAASRSSRTVCTSRRSSHSSRRTRGMRLNRANSQQEWNTFLLSSPDFSYE